MNRQVPRIRVAIVTAVTAAMAVVAAVAWACTPNAYIDVAPTSGPPGAEVTVSGRHFMEGPVDISFDGQELATAVGPNFSRAVTIPESEPGVHYFNASSGNWSASRPFRVTPKPPEPPPAPLEDPGPPEPLAAGSPANTNGNFVSDARASCAGRSLTVTGTAGDDVINGSAGRDVIGGLGGDDVIRGLEGNDVICGGPGSDRLVGGPGSDRLAGEGGSDRLLGGLGHDRLDGGSGWDACPGSAGDRATRC